MAIGDTRVLCTAAFQDSVPAWLKGQGKGWVTAEYDMLPSATNQRRRRNRTRIDGRTQEIQRLIGRSLRAVVDMTGLGENSILIDCDVVQADGGTRTAGITGAYVALCDAIRYAIRNKLLDRSPLVDSVAAVSVGLIKGRVLLDLCYEEDVNADADMNVVITGRGRFVEVQGTAEGCTFNRSELDRMIGAARRGIKQLALAQEAALRKRIRTR